MKCPVCQTVLTKEHGYLVCQDHGMLLTGAQLKETRSEQFDNKIIPKSQLVKSKRQAEKLACPNCSKQMALVDYVHTGVMIDVCSACPHRWLDTGEMERIIAHKPDMSGKQLLELEDLTRKLSIKHEAKSDAVRYFNIYRAVFAAYDGSSHRGIATLGIYGLIAGLLHSTFYRVLILIVVVVFAGVYWFAASNF